LSDLFAPEEDAAISLRIERHESHPARRRAVGRFALRPVRSVIFPSVVHNRVPIYHAAEKDCHLAAGIVSQGKSVARAWRVGRGDGNPIGSIIFPGVVEQSAVRRAAE